MKRVGYALVAACALLTIFTLALAQLETRNARYLHRVLTGRDLRGYFGSAVTPPAAYTGDRPLFAVSASGELGTESATGKVVLFDSTLADEPALEISGPVTGELFGAAISGGGDGNGDGLPDLAVGAPAGVGRVYLYFGGANFGAVAAVVLTAGEKGDQFGHAVDLTHDITGDGLADLIVGAPRSSRTGYAAGRVYVWFGRRDGLWPAQPDAEIGPGNARAQIGVALATGDVTGDGQADLALGVRGRAGDSEAPGEVLIFRGGPAMQFGIPSEVLRATDPATSGGFGEALVMLPASRAGGGCDLLVGAPEAVDEGRAVGRVYQYPGGAKLGAKPVAVFHGASTQGHFGERVFALGDVNGDGKADWAAQADHENSARGVIHFYYGGEERPFHVFTGESVHDRLGNALAVLDPGFAGRRYILVGARACDADAVNAGRVYLLRFE